ncbi:hypothetical protein BKA82DRAFT_4134664, partial [Pisolithus tinctorius]
LYVDGNTVFQGPLFVHSPTPESIFTLPSGVVNDGVDEEHPIKLPGISGGKFKHFVSCMYHVGSVYHDRNLPSLVVILKVINWVIIISTTVTKLKLACKYIIPQWIPPSVCFLVLNLLSAITEDEAYCLAHETLDMERHIIPAVPPGLSLPHHSVPLPSIPTKIAHQLSHPYNLLPLNSLVEFTGEQKNPDGLNLECKGQFVGEVVESAVTSVQGYYDTL